MTVVVPTQAGNGIVSGTTVSPVFSEALRLTRWDSSWHRLTSWTVGYTILMFGTSTSSSSLGSSNLFLPNAQSTKLSSQSAVNLPMDAMHTSTSAFP